MRRRESAADVCVPQLHTPLAKLWQSPKHARQNAAARLSPMSKKGMFARKGAVVKTVYSFGQRGSLYFDYGFSAVEPAAPGLAHSSRTTSAHTSQLTRSSRTYTVLYLYRSLSRCGS